MFCATIRRATETRARWGRGSTSTASSWQPGRTRFPSRRWRRRRASRAFGPSPPPPPPAAEACTSTGSSVSPGRPSAPSTPSEGASAATAAASAAASWSDLRPLRARSSRRSEWGGSSRRMQTGQREGQTWLCWLTKGVWRGRGSTWRRSNAAFQAVSGSLFWKNNEKWKEAPQAVSVLVVCFGTRLVLVVSSRWLHSALFGICIIGVATPASCKVADPAFLFWSFEGGMWQRPTRFRMYCNWSCGSSRSVLDRDGRLQPPLRSQPQQRQLPRRNNRGRHERLRRRWQRRRLWQARRRRCRCCRCRRCPRRCSRKPRYAVEAAPFGFVRCFWQPRCRCPWQRSAAARTGERRGAKRRRGGGRRRRGACTSWGGHRGRVGWEPGGGLVRRDARRWRGTRRGSGSGGGDAAALRGGSSGWAAPTPAAQGYRSGESKGNSARAIRAGLITPGRVLRCSLVAACGVGRASGVEIRLRGGPIRGRCCT